jgi:hypothetical protein
MSAPRGNPRPTKDVLKDVFVNGPEVRDVELAVDWRVFQLEDTHIGEPGDMWFQLIRIDDAEPVT